MPKMLQGDHHLRRGESTLWSGRTHWKILLGPLFAQLVLIATHLAVARWWPESTGVAWVDEWGQLVVHAGIVVFEAWYVLAPVLRWLNSTFTVTNRRVISSWGVLYKHSREIPLDLIVSVVVERGILDRMFRCGTLAFHDAASGAQPHTQGAWNQSPATAGVKFQDVPRVLEVRGIIDSTRYSNTEAARAADEALV